MKGNIPQTGKLALFYGPGQDFELKELGLRPLLPGELLVKNIYTTICGSDIHTYCGLREEPCPTVLGHEIVGEVLELHPDHKGLDLNGKALQPGDRITWTIFSSDPGSANALRGMPQKGEGLFKYGHARVDGAEVFHGGLGAYCILKPGTGIIRLPEDMPLPVAATLNCSVSTVAGALRMAGDIKGKRVLITGMGHLGITCAAMCREAGAEWVAAADVEEKRLKEALAFGAQDVFDMTGDKTLLKQSLLEKTGGRGLDLVFDMSGSPDAMEFSLDCLGIGGTAVWIGAVFKNRPLQIDAERVIRNLITIKGLHNYNFGDFKYAVAFMERCWQQYPFAGAVEKEFTLDAIGEAFEYAIARKPLRVGVRL
ncbi:zinc-binding dehydrogenase [Chitinophaga barathri]|uniref:Alcohol dehydrogenase n=1 Tax=Chitinophaga barathri TaxID=1647451 RepID=A0A3N4MHE1_9BACT|nr:zinc-binding dehydrogenase [Chitinophaga barathri]RPD39510.1 alcohol dehydrogenase [Chitinophaga barathri]